MEIENFLSELVKIKSVNPPGNEIEVARYLKHLFDREGIDNEILESAPGRANFIASIGDGEKRLLYLSHTDVVPVTEDWDLDPFSGEIKNGFVHGRGTLDCKDLVAAQAFALIFLAHNYKLKGKLIFSATADEEAGGNYGVKYLMEKYKEKLMADFAVTEGGEGPIRINNKTVYFVQTGEKGTAWTKLKAKGVACHGSIPTLGDNAVVKMAGAIKNLAQYKPEVKLIPEVKQLIQTLAALRGITIEVNSENIDSIIQSLEDKTTAEYLRAITRMTVSPNVVHGGVKTNIVPDSCEAEVDIRILPGQDKEYILKELNKNIPGDVGIEMLNYNPPSFSASDSLHYQLIVATQQQVLGDVISLPFISTGATDSRFLRREGIPSYGISIMAKDSVLDFRRLIHGRNEKIDIKSLKAKAEFLIKLAENYLVK